MGRRIVTLLLAVFFLALGPSAVAHDGEEVLVVVNAANDAKSIDPSAVKNFYLGTSRFWPNGQCVAVFQRGEDSAASKAFFREVLKMTPSRFRHHWQTLELSGQGVAPENAGSAASIVSKVAGTSGGIGFILESEREAAAGNAEVRVIELVAE